MPLSAIQPDRYDELLQKKVEALRPAFDNLEAPPPQVFSSPKAGFRLRVEFRLWHEGDRLFYAMFRPGEPRTPIPIASFPIAADSIQQLMPKLLSALTGNDTLRHKVFQVEFLSTLSGNMLVTLVYHRVLDDTWQAAAEALAAALNINIVGRSRKQKLIIGQDWVDESLNVKGNVFHYLQPEQSFTQPNGWVNQHMMGWATAACEELSGDLLELYCGNGNFTLPLASAFQRVIATEVSKVATRAALGNLERNRITNVAFARLSAEEMTQALNGTRPFRRLANLPVPLSEYQLNTLLVDPPRAGLDAATLSLASQFEKVLYISCNPATLLANLTHLRATHTIERLAFFDQFPYTSHLESGVLLTRRPA